MLEARGITYAYPGARTPLYRDFDLAVGPDERIATRVVDLVAR